MFRLFFSVFFLLTVNVASASVTEKFNIIEYRGKSINLYNLLLDTALSDSLEVPEHKCFIETVKDELGDEAKSFVCKHKDAMSLTQTTFNTSNPMTEQIRILSYSISMSILAGMKRDPNSKKRQHEVLKTERFCSGAQNTNCGVRLLSSLEGRVIRSINYPGIFCALKVTKLSIPSENPRVKKFHRCYIENTL